jgi:hypothetical protein
MGRDGRSVLVGVINRKKDLEIAFNQHWYRMPFKHAPKRNADFLALYQTRKFGKDGKSINYYATILGSSVVYRRELLCEEIDHPRADEPYCRLDLGDLRPTPRRIENRSRRRVVFGFTTLEKLFSAEEVSQLFDIYPIEDIMREALAESGIEALHEYCLMESRRCRYRLDFAIFCRGGKIDLECDNEKWHQQPVRQIKDHERDCWLKRHDWVVLRFPGELIRDNLKLCIGSLKQVIQELGGLSSS